MRKPKTAEMIRARWEETGDNEDRDDEENVSDTSEEDGQEADLSHFSYDGEAVRCHGR